MDRFGLSGYIRARGVSPRAHRARERIIELAARLQFNRQMGEASGQALNLR